MYYAMSSPMYQLPVTHDCFYLRLRVQIHASLCTEIIDSNAQSAADTVGVCGDR